MMRDSCWWLSTLAVVSLQASAQPLPRVFYSIEERQAITAMRRTGKDPNASVSVVTAAEAAGSPTSDPLPRVMKLEGISLAHSGGVFAWIGGKRYAEGARFGDWQLRISPRGVGLQRNGRVERQLRVGEPIGQIAAARATP
jgi:hypothetical protein